MNSLYYLCNFNINLNFFQIFLKVCLEKKNGTYALSSHGKLSSCQLIKMICSN